MLHVAQGCGVLCILAFNDANRMSIGSSGAIEAITTAMHTHPLSTRVQVAARKQILFVCVNWWPIKSCG